MKKQILALVVSGMFLLAPLFMLGQNPPHPNGGSGPNGGNTPVGGGAPIDGGISILLVLGVAYGSRKIYQLKK